MAGAPLRLIGGTGSPYTRKMLALLRYRRIPYAVTWGHPAQELQRLGIAPPRPVLLPTLLFEEAGEVRARCDSTPLIRRLEVEHAGRQVVPANPALAFIDYLLEDFADEWATKWMFHYRWAYALDEEMLGRWLASDQLGAAGRDTVEAMGKAFAQRQVGRMALVGCTPDTRPLIEETYVRTLTILDRHVTDIVPYLFGTRPSIADFALYGQLSQLINDPFADLGWKSADTIDPRQLLGQRRVAQAQYLLDSTCYFPVLRGGHQGTPLKPAEPLGMTVTTCPASFSRTRAAPPRYSVMPPDRWITWDGFLTASRIARGETPTLSLLMAWFRPCRV